MILKLESYYSWGHVIGTDQARMTKKDLRVRQKAGEQSETQIEIAGRCKA
jgi:hypothetical protein